ncbi:hypothetical protein FRB99_006319 [Tulasnella sp. 403]|nr:hypothetical protein FRB99_006319 [Tulasnella sp. 403]
MPQTESPADTSPDLINSAHDKVATYLEAMRSNPQETELYPKLLDAMLRFAPCESGKAYVAQSILSCSSHGDLHDLARRWIDNLLFPIRAQGGRTPAPSTTSSTLDQDPSTLLSSTTPELAKKDRGHMKLLRSQKSQFWQTVEMFSQVRQEELDGYDINRLENVLTLNITAHHLFGALYIWLKPIPDRPNCYEIGRVPKLDRLVPELLLPAGTVIELTTPDEANLPLPDPRYLALHAACAQIANVSGVAEYLKELVEELEDRAVLSEDGSSFRLLDHALSLVNAFS